MADERVRSGIPGLDEMVGGGYKRGAIMMVAGDSGAGKTTFAMQFLQSGAAKQKEPGMYISFEEERPVLFDNLAPFGWNLEKLEADKRLLFLEYPPQEVDHFMAQEVVIHDAIEESGVSRVVLDSITSFAMLYETEYRRRQDITRLLRKLRKWGCTVLLTSEADVANGIPRARFGVETLADGLVYLYNFRLKGDMRTRALEVVKMRGTAFESRIVPMKFTDSGLAVYPKERVYEGF